MQRWLLGDWGIKLGAVLLAGVLWFHAVTEHSFRRELDVPLVVTDPPHPVDGPPIVLASQPPPTVRIAVFGGGKDLLRTSGTEFVLRVEPPTQQPGTVSIRLDPEQVESHSELELVVEEVVEPRELTLHIDRRAERTVPIRPRIGLQLAESYTRVGEGLLEPDSVRIVGPSLQIGAIRAIETDSLFEAEVRADIDRHLDLTVPAGALIELSHSQAHVRIDVQELAEYEIANVPVLVRGAPAAAVAEPSRVTVRVRGGADLIGGLDPESDLALYVDFDADSAGTRRPIQVPRGRLYEIRQITPAHADVVLR